MFRSVALAAASFFLLLASGCAIPQGAPVLGGLYTNVKGPVGPVNDSVRATKTGSAMATAIVGVATGDASIPAAMQAGGITKVHHAESESFGIMSVYATYKITVHGE